MEVRERKNKFGVDWELVIKLLDDGKHLKAVLKTQITWREISSLIIVTIIITHSAIKVLFR